MRAHARLIGIIPGAVPQGCLLFVYHVGVGVATSQRKLSSNADPLAAWGVAGMLSLARL